MDPRGFEPRSLRLQRSAFTRTARDPFSGAARAAPLRRSEFGEASPHAARRSAPRLHPMSVTIRPNEREKPVTSLKSNGASWERRESHPHLAVKSRLLDSRATLPRTNAVGPYRVERSSFRPAFTAQVAFRGRTPSSVSGAARAAPLRRSEFGEASPHAVRRLGLLTSRTGTMS